MFKFAFHPMKFPKYQKMKTNYLNKFNGNNIIFK